MERAIAEGEAAAIEVTGESRSGTGPAHPSRASVGPPGGMVISAASVSTAASYATRLAHEALEQGMQTALRAYRFAGAAEG